MPAVPPAILHSSVTTKVTNTINQVQEEWIFPERRNRFLRSGTIYGKAEGTRC